MPEDNTRAHDDGARGLGDNGELAELAEVELAQRPGGREEQLDNADPRQGDDLAHIFHDLLVLTVLSE